MFGQYKRRCFYLTDVNFLSFVKHLKTQILYFRPKNTIFIFGKGSIHQEEEGLYVCEDKNVNLAGEISSNKCYLYFDPIPP